MRKIIVVRLFLCAVVAVMVVIFTGCWMKVDKEVYVSGYASELPVTPFMNGDNAVKLPTTWESVVVRPLVED